MNTSILRRQRQGPRRSNDGLMLFVSSYRYSANKCFCTKAVTTESQESVT